jgi:hypothetical protein
VYQDVWAALHLPNNSEGELGQILASNITKGAQDLFVPRDGSLCPGREECVAAQSEVLKFVGMGATGVPVWLAVTYLSSNVVLNSLNFYWFGKMIETVRKRFEKPKPEESKGENEDKSGNAKRETVHRRRSSIVLDVADGLQRSMMDVSGEVELDFGKSGMQTQAPERVLDQLNLNTHQTRNLEAKMEGKGQTTALESNNHTTSSTRDTNSARRR